MDNKADSMLWTEKYRPKSLDIFEAPGYLKRFLAHAIENGHPHLLLYGPPGTGKTTFAEMLKPTMRLNASDERGIDVIRNKVKKRADTLNKEVILLDECENLSKDAQTCLRRIMEDYAGTTFIFCTNYYSRIIDPLKSRLLKLKFTGMHSGILDKIGKDESFNFPPSFYDNLFKKCKGDLRKSINILQGIKPLLTNEVTEWSDREIDDLIGRVHEKLENQFHKLNEENCEKYVRDFVNQGFSVLQLIHQLAENILGKETQKALFSLALAKSEGYAINGCSDELILRYLCFNKILIYNKINQTNLDL